MIQLNVNVPLNGDKSLQKLVENIQLLTGEDSSIDQIQYKMETLEEQVADIVVRVSKCEDQAGTVEDVLDKLNRLSESIDVLQEDNRSIREMEINDVTEMRDMLESLNAESRGLIERVEDMDKISTSNLTQQEVANKQNLGLLEESLLKHEEHSAELDELKIKLEDANIMNSKLSAKLTVVSEKYDELTRESMDQQEKNDAIQRNQTELIQTLQDRVKSLETQLSNTSSPYRFSPTSDLGEETDSKSNVLVSELEDENVKLLEKIDKLQVENTQLREDMIEPVTDEEIIENSSDEEEPPLESIVLPKPIFSQSKTARETKLKLQGHRDKLSHIQSLADSIDEDHKDFITKIARIQSTAMRRKQETPRTPYVWLIDSVSIQIEKEGLVYSQPFISEDSGHKIGALLDFSMAKSSHDPSIGFYITMLPGNNDKKLKWPFRAEFRVTLVNYLNNDKCLIQKFSDSGNIAFQMPLKGKNLNMFGLTKFITVATLTNPRENRLYVRNDRMELHIEVQVNN